VSSVHHTCLNLTTKDPRRIPLSEKRTTRTTRAKPTAKKATVKKTTATRKAPVKKTAAPAKTPAKPRAKVAAPAASRKLLDLIVKTLDADKAEDITSIDMMGRSPMADFMVVASGRSNRHVSALAEHLTETLKKDGIVCRTEGLQQGDWVLIDAIDIIVHVFRPEVRDFYELEKMWGGSEAVAVAS
jgi:ribosome-associated protein